MASILFRFVRTQYDRYIRYSRKTLDRERVQEIESFVTTTRDDTRTYDWFRAVFFTRTHNISQYKAHETRHGQRDFHTTAELSRRLLRYGLATALLLLFSTFTSNRKLKTNSRYFRIPCRRYRRINDLRSPAGYIRTWTSHTRVINYNRNNRIDHL